MADTAIPEAPGLCPTSPDGPLYRIARAPDPWSWPEWANVGNDGTFGNRWDDPNGVYRVIYAAGSRLGAFVEVLSRFRPDLHVLQELAEIEGEGAPAVAPGDLDVAWLAHRRMGVAGFRGEFADIGHSSSLTHVRAQLASRVVHYGLDDLDAAAIRLSAPRRFTQEISRHIYKTSTPEGRPRFVGIAYRSRLGDEFRNWAIFEPAGSDLPVIREPEAHPIQPDDPDLTRAVELLGLRLTGDWASGAVLKN